MGEMINKLKSYATYALGLLAAFSAIFLFRERRKNESLQSELATEKSNAVVKENDNERQIAKEHADELLADYARKRAEYDEQRMGGESDDV